MKVRVKKWGNSAAVRIPAPVMEAAELCLEDEVELREVEGRILIEPVRQKSYRLEDLINDISVQNLPEAVEFGPPVGRESW